MTAAAGTAANGKLRFTTKDHPAVLAPVIDLDALYERRRGVNALMATLRKWVRMEINGKSAWMTSMEFTYAQTCSLNAEVILQTQYCIIEQLIADYEGVE
jgi:hypothetical protein